MFNQVGIIAINAMGYELGDLSAPSRKGLPPRLENELEFDPVTTDRLKQLIAAKDKAVENEDFDEAKKLRDVIDRLKSVGQQLMLLEERKRNAIAKEEYEAAKVIKMEIDRLRNAVAPPNENNYFARPFSGNKQPSGVGRPYSKSGPGQLPPVPQIVPPPPIEFDSYSKPSKNDFYSKGPESFEPKSNPFSSKAPISHDEQVIPTVLHGKAPGKNIYEEDDNEGNPKGIANVPENLGIQQEKFAEPFIHILGENICKQIFSKTWNFREEGLGKIQTELSKGSSSEIFGEIENTDIYTAVLGAIRYTIGDKIAQVTLKAMGLLGLLLKNLSPSRSSLRGEVAEYIQSCLASLLDKIGDNNARVREIAEQTYLMLARSEIVGSGLAVQAILRPNKEKSVSQKHNIGRLNLLVAIVEEFRIDNSSVPFQPIVDYAITGFTNSNSDIRNAAYSLLMSIYKCVGNKLGSVVSDSKSLRPAQVEILQKGFSEVEIGTYQEPKSISTNKPKDTKPPVSNANLNNAMCGFCGKSDPVFANQDNLDIHYWKDCPMLVGCLQCSQIVEILHLNSHMLKECELKELVKQCSRCKEAIHIDEFEQHVEEQSCLAAKPPSRANRCPLCHEDVDPEPSGWIKHIITDGCSNNDRSNY